MRIHKLCAPAPAIHSFIPDDRVVRATLSARVIDEVKIRHRHFQAIVTLDALFALFLTSSFFFFVVVVVSDFFFCGVRFGCFLLLVRQNSIQHSEIDGEITQGFPTERTGVVMTRVRFETGRVHQVPTR